MDFEATARAIADAVAARGGRALIVGGFVRDRVLGLQPKDVDVEVYGLAVDALVDLLGEMDAVDAVGKSFGVLKFRGLDVSIPRRDSKTGRGHKGFLVEPDPSMTFAEASRRRDFTMNSMSMDPITGEILDPHGGRRDLAAKTLRMTDEATFGEDPLRILRAAQFVARFELAPDAALVRVSTDLRRSLLELPAERLWEEWCKLMLKGRRPSLGLAFLRQARIVDAEKAQEIGLFPEVSALIGCPQDPEWHPEGDVWVHTLMALDVAATQRTGDAAHDLALLFGTLCHDFGKPPTTAVEDGRIRSRGHEDAGVRPSREFLERMRAPADLIDRVCALVADHLAPAHFAHPHMASAGPSAYRRLARKLAAAGTSIDMLTKVARADHLGRTTPDAVAGEFPAGEAFLARAKEAAVADRAEPDVVLGRHLIARGMKPGKEFGPILAKCREVQDQTGLKDAEAILQRVLEGGKTA